MANSWYNLDEELKRVNRDRLAGTALLEKSSISRMRKPRGSFDAYTMLRHPQHFGDLTLNPMAAAPGEMTSTETVINHLFKQGYRPTAEQVMKLTNQVEGALRASGVNSGNNFNWDAAQQAANLDKAKRLGLAVSPKGTGGPAPPTRGRPDEVAIPEGTRTGGFTYQGGQWIYSGSGGQPVSGPGPPPTAPSGWQPPSRGM